MGSFILTGVGAVIWLVVLLVTDFNPCAVSAGLLALVCLPDRMTRPRTSS